MSIFLFSITLISLCLSFNVLWLKLKKSLVEEPFCSKVPAWEECNTRLCARGCWTSLPTLQESSCAVEGRQPASSSRSARSPGWFLAGLEKSSPTVGMRASVSNFAVLWSHNESRTSCEIPYSLDIVTFYCSVHAFHFRRAFMYFGAHYNRTYGFERLEAERWSLNDCRVV